MNFTNVNRTGYPLVMYQIQRKVYKLYLYNWICSYLESIRNLLENNDNIWVIWLPWVHAIDVISAHIAFLWTVGQWLQMPKSHLVECTGHQSRPDPIGYCPSPTNLSLAQHYRTLRELLPVNDCTTPTTTIANAKLIDCVLQHPSLWKLIAFHGWGDTQWSAPDNQVALGWGGHRPSWVHHPSQMSYVLSCWW